MFFLTGEGDVPAHEIAPPAQSWGDAWSELAGSTRDMQRFSENANNADEARIEAYRRRNQAIHQATGVQLDNPVDLYAEGWRPRGTNAYSLETVTDQLNARAAEKRAEWLARTAELKARFPDRSDLFDDTVDQEALALTRAARADYQAASEDPALGALGRLSAILAGGGAGILRDPTFAPLVIAGPAAGVGKTVAGRIGRVMLFEAAINAGAELGVQAMAEPWKQRAGVETSWQEFFLNAGLAGAFGAGLGGGIQGGVEIYRAIKLKAPARAAADRIIANRPEAGDVETVAAALGREIPDDQAAMLTRSFDEDALDGYIAGPDATPEELMVAEAARRFAEDPDNYPPPEIVERMLADRMALKDGTISEYGRAMDLDETFFAEAAPAPLEGRLAPADALEPLDDADLARAETLARGEAEELVSEVASDALPPIEAVRSNLGHDVIEERTATVAPVADDIRSELPRSVAAFLDANATKMQPRNIALHTDPLWAYLLDADGKVWRLGQSEHNVFFDAIRAGRNIDDEGIAAATGIATLRLSRVGKDLNGGLDFYGTPTKAQVRAFKRMKREMGDREDALSVSLWRDENLRLKPETRAESPEMKSEPKPRDPDAPKLADYDDDGVVQYRTLDEWLDEAEVPARHADLLEACKL